MINDNADKVIEELFQSALSRYQIGLETSMRDSNFYLIVFIYYKGQQRITKTKHKLNKR